MAEGTKFVVIGWRESDADCLHPTEDSLRVVGVYDTLEEAEAAEGAAATWKGLTYFGCKVLEWVPEGARRSTS